jgi:hypothetical protein
LQTLIDREDADLLACNRIGRDVLVLEVFPLVLDARHTTDTPAHTEIDLLMFPVLGKDHAPEAAQNTVQGGEVSEKQPCRSTESRGEN